MSKMMQAAVVETACAPGGASSRPGRGEILVRIEATGHARTSPRAYSGLNYNASKERAMNWQRRIFTATLALISFIGDINNTSPAAAASHYPLWVCGGRYGGWGGAGPRARSLA